MMRTIVQSPGRNTGRRGIHDRSRRSAVRKIRTLAIDGG